MGTQINLRMLPDALIKRSRPTAADPANDEVMQRHRVSFDLSETIAMRTALAHERLLWNRLEIPYARGRLSL